MDRHANDSTPSPSVYDATTMTTETRTPARKFVVRRTSVPRRSLPTQTNAFCFINHLPVEILEAVFIHYAREYFKKHCGSTVPTPPDWVRVSYVSRHWRDVSLNCHYLWSYLFITSSRWTKELLTRSKQAPLRLHVFLHDSGERLSVSRSLEQIMAHSERIEELNLDIPFKLTSQYIHSRLSSPAPRLRILKANSFFSRDFPVLFGGDTPVLETLVLRTCSAAWYSLNLTCLTMLDLFFVPLPFQQDVLGFFITLSCMQNLEHLSLACAISNAKDFLSSPAFRTFQKIKLSSLSFLRLSSPLSTIIAFLSCVQVPLKTRVNLFWTEDNEDPSFPSYLASFKSLVAQRFTISGDHVFSIPVIRSLTITWVEGKDVGIVFNTSKCVYSFSNILLKLHFPFAQFETMRDEDHAEEDILAAVPLSNVQSLRVIDPMISLASWRHILGHLPDLRHIELNDGFMPDLAPVLSISPCEVPGSATHHNTNRDRDHILAPALEGLKLFGVAFKSAPAVGRDPLGHSGVRSLCDALATRKAPRGQLLMVQCTKDDSEGYRVEFNMTGWWEGGHFGVSTMRVEQYI